MPTGRSRNGRREWALIVNGTGVTTAWAAEDDSEARVVLTCLRHWLFP
jgi:hypothetical protein